MGNNKNDKTKSTISILFQTECRSINGKESYSVVQGKNYIVFFAVCNFNLLL